MCIKNIFIILALFCVFENGFGQNQYNKSQSRLDKLYPSKSTVIKYHTDWTKNHYKERIFDFKNDPLDFGDIVFIGNSITERGKDWSSRFDIEHIKNRGIAGDVTDGVLKRLDEIIYFKPKAIFLLIGINDLFNLHNEDESPHRRYEKRISSAEYVAKNILKIAKKIHKKTPETKLYIRTILPTDRDFMKKDIIAVNNIVKQNEKEGFYKVIDLHKVFTDKEGKLKKDYTIDGVHVNEMGYRRWIEIEKQILFDF